LGPFKKLTAIPGTQPWEKDNKTSIKYTNQSEINAQESHLLTGGGHDTNDTPKQDPSLKGFTAVAAAAAGSSSSSSRAESREKNDIFWAGLEYLAVVLIFIIRSRNGILDIFMPTYVCYVYGSTNA
jgi:hypothetical protein